MSLAGAGSFGIDFASEAQSGLPQTRASPTVSQTQAPDTSLVSLAAAATGDVSLRPQGKRTRGAYGELRPHRRELRHEDALVQAQEVGPAQPDVELLIPKREPPAG